MSLWLLLIGCTPTEPSWALLDPVVEPSTETANATPPAERAEPATEQAEPATEQAEPATEQAEPDPFDTYKKVTAEGEKGWGPPAEDEAPESILGRPEPEGGAARGDEDAGDEDAGDEDAGDEGEDIDDIAEEPGEPQGMPTEASWGVRLVQTFENRQPPRALLGLPSGEEVVVSAGSMLPDVGLVVIAVGSGMIQLAQVLPDGDHATIETTILHAQYGGSSAGGAE